MKRVSATISGRVQGVTYRASTRKQAAKLGLTGWVRNLASGDVELVAEGEEATLEDLIQWCHRGPFLARVDTVATQWSEATGEFDSFDVR